MFMEEEEFQQQELFETEKYISDLVEEKTKKRGSSLNLVFLSSFLQALLFYLFYSFLAFLKKKKLYFLIL